MFDAAFYDGSVEEIEKTLPTLLTKYKNGNYYVKLYSDGTKIRYTEDDEFLPTRPESIDITITDKCDGGCAFCYADSGPNGLHGDLSQKFFETILPGTEIAINLNDMSHPDLEWFLAHCKHLGIIVNGTINMKHFMKDDNYSRLSYLSYRGLIHGIGISYSAPCINETVIRRIQTLPNTVIHAIAGMFDEVDSGAIEIHYNKDLNPLKLLILGYKVKGRAAKTDITCDYFKSLLNNTKTFINKNKDNPDSIFSTIAFDNLAVKQLELEKDTDPEWYSQHYLGDDGEYTFFIDAVKKKYAISSTSNEYFDIKDGDTVETMFRNVRGKVDGRTKDI